MKFQLLAFILAASSTALADDPFSTEPRQFVASEVGSVAIEITTLKKFEGIRDPVNVLERIYLKGSAAIEPYVKAYLLDPQANDDSVNRFYIGEPGYCSIYFLDTGNVEIRRIPIGPSNLTREAAESEEAILAICRTDLERLSVTFVWRNRRDAFEYYLRRLEIERQRMAFFSTLKELKLPPDEIFNRIKAFEEAETNGPTKH